MGPWDRNKPPPWLTPGPLGTLDTPPYNPEGWEPAGTVYMPPDGSVEPPPEPTSIEPVDLGSIFVDPVAPPIATDLGSIFVDPVAPPIATDLGPADEMSPGEPASEAGPASELSPGDPGRSWYDSIRDPYMDSRDMSEGETFDSRELPATDTPPIQVPTTGGLGSATRNVPSGRASDLGRTAFSANDLLKLPGPPGQDRQNVDKGAPRRGSGPPGMAPRVTSWAPPGMVQAPQDARGPQNVGPVVRDIAPGGAIEASTKETPMDPYSGSQEEADRLLAQKNAEFALKRADFDAKLAQQTEARSRKLRDEAIDGIRHGEVMARELANTEVKYRGSAFTKFTQVLAGALGGINAAFRGGRNFGLEAVMQNVDRDISMQKEELANKRYALGQHMNAMGQLMQAGLNEYQAAGAYRLMMHDSIDSALAAEQAKYIEGGFRGQRLVEMRQRNAELRARELEKQVQESLTWANTEAKREAETTKIYFDMDMAQQEIDLKRELAARKARAGTAKPTEWADVVMTPEQLKLYLGPDAPMPPVPMSPKQYDGWLKTQRDVRSLSKEAALERVAEGTEKTREIQTGVPFQAKGMVTGAKTKSGKPLIFPDEYAAEVRKLKPTADMLVSSLDDLIAITTEHGWQSDTLKKDSYRQAKQAFSNIVTDQNKIAELGALAGADLDLIIQQIGTGDPTEFRQDFKGALKKARANVVKRMNDKFRAGGAFVVEDDGSYRHAEADEIDWWEPPVSRRRQQVERTRDQNKAQIKSGIKYTAAEGAVDPAKEAMRVESVEDARQAITHSLRRQELDNDDFNEIAQDIESHRQNGRLTRDEAYDLMHRVAIRRWKSGPGKSEVKLPSEESWEAIQGAEPPSLLKNMNPDLMYRYGLTGNVDE